MKKALIGLLILIFILAVNGCTKESKKEEQIVKISIITDKTEIVADNTDKAQIICQGYMDNGEVVKIGDFELYVNDNISNIKEIKSGSEGKFKVYAKAMGYESNTVTISAIKKQVTTSTSIEYNGTTVTKVISSTPPSGELQETTLEVSNDTLMANGLVNLLGQNNIFVIRGEFDGWTSFNTNWFNVNPDDVILSEEKGKILINTQALINRGVIAGVASQWSNSIKIVAFTKEKKFIAEFRENIPLNSLVTVDKELSDVVIKYNNIVTKSDAAGKFKLVLSDEKEKIRFYKKGYFYKEIAAGEAKNGEAVVIGKLTGTLSGDIRYEKIAAPEILGGIRTMSVYLPPGYETNDTQRFPVLYVNDGKSVFDSSNYIGEEMSIDETMEKFTEDKVMEGYIVVGIDEMNNRTSEYVPWDWFDGEIGDDVKGLGKEYLKFLAEDIKGYIDSKYRTLPERENTIIAGCSLGGLISLYSQVEYGDVFGGVIAFSPSLFINSFQLAKELKLAQKSGNAKIYFDISQGELPFMGGESAYRNIEASLSSAGYKSEEVRLYISPTGQHSPISWGERFPNALLWCAE